MPDQRKAADRRIGTDWDGQLDEWVAFATIGPNKGGGGQDYSFPTDQLRDQYLGSLASRSGTEVRALLSKFLFPPTSFGADDVHVERILSADDKTLLDLITMPYYKRLAARLVSKRPVHDGTDWVLELLPDHPQSAIEVLDAYLIAFWGYLPDGRVNGLFDAMALIRGYYIGHPSSAETKRLSLYDLGDRDFERLVERTYDAMGYRTVLTRKGKDGGRDVIATRIEAGQREKILIDCKLYRRRVTVTPVRALAGVVGDAKVNKGILAAADGFTQPAVDFANANPLELLRGDELVVLLNQHFGSEWPTRIDRLLNESRRLHPDVPISAKKRSRHIEPS